MREPSSHRDHSIKSAVALAGAICGALIGGCDSHSAPTPAAPMPAAQTSAANQGPIGDQGPAGDQEPSAGAASKVAGEDDNKLPGVEVKILDYDGIRQLIAGHRGKVVVMDAWSTSCGPCLREFPHLVVLHNRYGRADVACVSLSFDFEGLSKPEDELPRVLKFLRSKNATFDNILSSDPSDDLYRRFGLASIPAVFVFDRQGELRKRFDNEDAQAGGGPFTYEQVAALVAELVQEPR